MAKFCDDMMAQVMASLAQQSLFSQHEKDELSQMLQAQLEQIEYLAQTNEDKENALHSMQAHADESEQEVAYCSAVHAHQA